VVSEQLVNLVGAHVGVEVFRLGVLPPVLLLLNILLDVDVLGDVNLREVVVYNSNIFTGLVKLPLLFYFRLILLHCHPGFILLQRPLSNLRSEGLWEVVMIIGGLRQGLVQRRRLLRVEPFQRYTMRHRCLLEEQGLLLLLLAVTSDLGHQQLGFSVLAAALRRFRDHSRWLRGSIL